MGKPQFYRATTVESMPSYSLDTINQTLSTDIPANTDEAIYFYAPPGKIGRIIGCSVYWRDFVSTVGTKRIDMIAQSGLIGLTRGRSATNETLNYQYGEWSLEQAPSTEQFPVDSGAGITALVTAKFTEINSFTVRFANESDTGSGTSERAMRLHFEYQDIA